MKKTLLLAVIFLGSVFLFESFGQKQKYSRVKIEIEKNQVFKLAEKGLSLEFRYQKDGLVVEYSQKQLETVSQLGYSYDVLIPDVTKYYVENNLKGGPAVRTERTPENFNLGSMGGYLTLDEVMLELDDMRALYPDFISAKEEITTEYTTHDGNYVYWVRLSDNPDTDETDEHEVLYTSLHHAREPVSMMQLVYMMWYLLENNQPGSEAEYLLNNFEMYFVLCENPDGYLYNEQTDPDGGGMWRKNRRDNGGSYGVDPNRNYPYEWGYDNSGSSPTPSMETYRGPSAGSEPITQMMMEFVANHNFLICDNHHTYSNLLLYSWAYDEIYPADLEVFEAFTDIMTRENGYITGQPWEVLYPVNGDSNDWMYGEHGVLAMTSETGDEFWPPQSEIIPLCEGNLEMNLFQTRLAGMYAEATDITDNIIPKHGYLEYDIYFIGLDVSGDYTVSINSDDFEAGAPKTYTAGSYQQLEIKQDSIFYFIGEEFGLGHQISYTLTVDNGTYAYSQTITKTIGKQDIVFENSGDDISDWTTNGWTVTNETAHSPVNSVTDSEGGDYSNNAYSYIATDNAILLDNSSMLSFWANCAIESNWDYAQLLISTNGGSSWTPLETQSSEDGTGSFQPTGEPVYDGNFGWTAQSVNLDSYAEQEVSFRFEFHSDGSVTEDGFYFDDFTVSAVNTTNIVPEITNHSDLFVESNFMSITLTNLTVEDSDSNFPDDFLLFINEGENYSVTENGVEIDDGYAGEISIPVSVHDGFDMSDIYTIVEDVTTSVDNFSAKDVQVAPNPASNVISVSVPDNYFNSVIISDIYGKIIDRKPLTGSKTTINTASLKAGIYLLHFTGKETVIKKLIINK